MKPARTFKLELFESQMPITTKNFIDLAEKGFYDGSKFHRVIEGFMVRAETHCPKMMQIKPGGEPATRV